jgi:cytochrome c biogenesis protein ResB
MQDATQGSTQVSGKRLLRAGLLGLCAGMLLGGCFLLLQGVRARHMAPDCQGYTEHECALVREASSEVGRVQMLSGGCLVALSAALGLLLRPRPTAP